LYIRIKKNAYIMPLFVTGILALGLLGHNQYMKYQERQFKAEIIEFSTKLKAGKEKIKKYEILLKESEKIKQDITDTRNKINFVKKEADKNLNNLITYFTTIAFVLPEELVLNSILQKQANEKIFFIKGRSFELDPIGQFATSLQQYQWCDSAVLKKLKADGKNKLDFEISVTTLGTKDKAI
ncbi:MAG: hypothetical protein KAR45_15925, partial [Desulfobacteraceae bacterium]|nr:hypothetical protein [Desulfobacteraceae bacterium]